MFIRYFFGFLIFLSSSVACSKTWVFQANQKIIWDEISNGDTVCLTGTRTGMLEIDKNITLDGNCGTQGSMSGLVKPDWVKIGDVWRTTETYPLQHGRYSSWVLKNGQLLELLEAEIYREGDYFYSTVEPEDISIPKYYAAIVVKGTNGLTIKNLDVSYYHTNGLRFTDTENTTVENVSVSWFGGGINPSGFPRAGDGITFDGNVNGALVKDSMAYQCYDTGFAVQLFKPVKEVARGVRFIGISTDKCGAGISIATHKRGGSIIDDVEIVGKFTNSGYGWSGLNNTVHGRGVLILQQDESSVTNIRLHDTIIDRYAWVGILHVSGELDAWNNIIINGTGDYTANKYIKPSAYTAHGLDYSRDDSDDEAVGSFHDNIVLNNNGYAFQVIHNRPKSSTRQLTITGNRLHENKAELNLRTSNAFLK